VVGDPHVAPRTSAAPPRRFPATATSRVRERPALTGSGGFPWSNGLHPRPARHPRLAVLAFRSAQWVSSPARHSQESYLANSSRNRGRPSPMPINGGSEGKDRECIQPEQYERSSAARARAAARLRLFLALAAHDLRLSLQVILSIDPWLARRLTTTSHHRVRAGIPRTRQACTGDRNAANLEHATALCLPSDCNLEQAQGRFTTVDYSSQSFGERDTHRSCAWPTPC
jgi:hypothetical protein